MVSGTWICYLLHYQLVWVNPHLHDKNLIGLVSNIAGVHCKQTRPYKNIPNKDHNNANNTSNNSKETQISIKTT